MRPEKKNQWIGDLAVGMVGFGWVRWAKVRHDCIFAQHYSILPSSLRILPPPIVPTQTEVHEKKKQRK